MTQRIPAAVLPLGLEALRCRLHAINATPMSVCEYVSKKQFQSDAVRPPPAAADQNEDVAALDGFLTVLDC
jgi:hypothetical protein